MSFRTFALGATLGACVTAFAAYWLAPSLPSTAGPLSQATALIVQAPPGEVGCGASAPTAAATPAQPALSPGAVMPTTTALSRMPPVVSAQPLPPTVPPVPVATPIALAQEHAKLLRPEVDPKKQPTLPELHQQLESEVRDDAWAIGMEQSIRDFLTANNIAAAFEISAVTCRKTLCEVLAFGNQPGSGAQWNSVWSIARTQPWYEGISGESTSSSSHNQRYVIVTILQRSKRG